MDYEKVYNRIVEDLVDYVKEYNLKSLILGISGGIDSTVCAAICREVCDRTDTKLIGRSLPIKNKNDEFKTSILVGQAFCDDFKTVPIKDIYNAFQLNLFSNEENSVPKGYIKKNEAEEFNTKQTKIANGNIQARLRMIYLYNLASINNGIVIDTDNQTEHYLGFFTKHGDEGDYQPIIGLWKTEVYELANYILQSHSEKDDYGKYKVSPAYIQQHEALISSVSLTPTDGLGISNSDLEQIGASSYEVVDDILRTYLKHQYTCGTEIEGCGLINDVNGLYKKYTKEVVDNVLKRMENSRFKRAEKPGTQRYAL